MANVGDVIENYRYVGGPLHQPTSWEPVGYAGGLKAGHVEDGYEFMGGSPSDPRNWRPTEEGWGEYFGGLGRSALQGATFGFGEELLAGARSVDSDETYQQALEDERSALRTFRSRHPYAAFGAELAGSLPLAAIPGAGVARAATLGERLAQSAKAGAAMGAAYGAGAGEGGLLERGKSAAVGAVGGAVAGPLATEVAAPAIGRAAQALSGQGAGRAATIQNARERLRDIAAMRQMGIEPFGPALADKGVATAARGLEQVPIIGRVIKEPKAGVEAQLAAERDRIAGMLGAMATDEETGMLAQRGLDRYRTARLQNLEPGVVGRLGVAPAHPTPGAPGQISIADAAPQYVSRFSTAGLTDEQLAAAASSGRDSGVSFVGGARRGIEDLKDAELSRVLRAPAHQTSFATRQEALYEDAYRSFPKRFKVTGAANPELIATPNSSVIAQGMLQQEESAQISGGVLEGRFGPLVKALVNSRRNFTIPALRAARTEIGRALNNYGTYDVRLDRGQLKQLYFGLSRDMEQAMVSIAARARAASRLPPSIKGKRNPAYVKPADADMADRALSKLRRADRYTRAGIERMDRFMSVLNANTFEEAGRKIGRFVRENTSNLGALRTMKSALRPEEWNGVAGHVVSNMGRGRAGAAEAEAGFNVNTWATDWNRLSPSAKDVLFGRGGDLRQSLDRLARVVERMKYYETTRNVSGTANTLLGVGVAQGAVATLFNPGLLAQSIATMGGTAALSKFLTSKAYVGWLTRAYQMEARGATQAQWQAHLKVLSKLAGHEPEIGDTVMRAAIIAAQQGGQA